MKKPLSKKALLREADFWVKRRMLIREDPGKTCRK